jgi:hypothetical protein
VRLKFLESTLASSTQKFRKWHILKTSWAQTSPQDGAPVTKVWLWPGIHCGEAEAVYLHHGQLAHHYVIKMSCSSHFVCIRWEEFQKKGYSHCHKVTLPTIYIRCLCCLMWQINGSQTNHLMSFERKHMYGSLLFSKLYLGQAWIGCILRNILWNILLWHSWQP